MNDPTPTQPTPPMEARLASLEAELRDLREQLAKEIRTERLVIVNNGEERIVAQVFDQDDAAEIILTGDRTTPSKLTSLRVFAEMNPRGDPRDFMGVQWRFSGLLHGMIFQGSETDLAVDQGEDW